MSRDRLIGILLVVATTASWGGAWVTARAAAHDAPAEWMAVGRFVVAAAALLVVAALMRRPISLRHDRPTWTLLFGMALTGAIGYNLLFLTGIEKAPASDGAVITPGLSGFLGGIWVWLLDGIKPRRLAIAGGILSILGAAAIGYGTWDTSGGAERALGQFLFVGASVTWGLYTAFGRRLAGKVPAVESVFWATALAAMLFVPYAWWQAGAPDAQWAEGAWWNMLYLGLIATAVGFVTWYLAVQRLGADRAGPGLGLVPVFGVGLAVVFLDEQLGWWHVLGAALVILGIAVSGQRMQRVLRVRHTFPADKERTWRVLADFGGLAKYTDDLRACEQLEGQGLHVGAVRRNVFSKPQAGIESVTERVTAVGERSFGYEIVGPLGPYPRVTAEWRLHGEAGHAVLEYEARFDSGLLGYLGWPMTKRNLTRGLRKMFAGMDQALA